MINYQTILSSFDNKLTLMQWLNKVEDALKGGSLSSVSLSQPTATTAVLTFHFADGSSLESPTLVLPQGPQGPKGEDGKDGKDGEDGKDGTSVRILPNAQSCTELGDGYIDANGHLQVLTNLDPRTFEDAGLIRGPQGPAGQNGTDGTDGTDGVSVTNVAVTNTNHLVVTLSNGTTIDAGAIQVSEESINIINSTDIVSNTLTQAQYDLITNGKPTLILGTLLGHKNMFIFSWFDATTTIRAIAICELSFFSLLINVSTKVISEGGNDIGLSKISRFNEKAIPAYPVDLTKDYLLKQNKTTGALEWIEFSITDHTGYVTLKIGNDTFDLEKHATGNNVTLTITEGGIIGKNYLKIYDGQDNTGTLLFESVGEVITPSPINVICTSGYLYIQLDGSAPLVVPGTTTTSANIVEDEGSVPTGGANLALRFAVNGNGTINITIEDWDYD